MLLQDVTECAYVVAEANCKHTHSVKVWAQQQGQGQMQAHTQL